MKKTPKMTLPPRNKTGKKGCSIVQHSNWRRSTSYSWEKLVQVFKNVSFRQILRNWSSCLLQWARCAPFSHSKLSRISISSFIFKCICKLRRSLYAVEIIFSSAAQSNPLKMWLTATFASNSTRWTSSNKRPFPTSLTGHHRKSWKRWRWSKIGLFDMEVN